MNVATLPHLWQSLVGSMASFLHRRSAWRLLVVLFGLLFAQGRRRTVTTWIRAAQVQEDFPSFYYFLGSLGRNCALPAVSLLRAVLHHLHPELPSDAAIVFTLDDTPSERYGPHVQGAGIHHNPSRGPADAAFLYGHIWVTLCVMVCHPQWGPISLPIRSLLYVRKKDVPKIPAHYGWRFRSKLELAAELVRWAADMSRFLGLPMHVVVDGAYAKKPFMKEATGAGLQVISRLRRDAGLRTLPRPRRQPRRGRPAVYGSEAIRLNLRARQKRGWQTVQVQQYGKVKEKRIKTFLATWRPAGGVIRVVLVQEETGWLAWFSTDPELSAELILERAAQRTTIEETFHDVKEVEGLGEPQLRNIWSNVGAMEATLWEFTLVELWAWDQPQEAICDRSESPWDDAERRPSHADRRKALQRWCLRQEYQRLCQDRLLQPEMQEFVERLLRQAG